MTLYRSHLIRESNNQVLNGIAAGPDAALWFTSFNTNSIVRVLPSLATAD